MNSVAEIFGSLVFNDATMKARLPRETYKALQKTIKDGKRLDINIANIVAISMKEWALEHGVTHFTHWFQPMTGVTAEKHDSFISPAENGNVIMEFSGKELVQGEPDASSFPSGGLRATFEARGYTTWDPTSYAFIKGNTLCIPTAFCSYGGEALDKKTPLLRSMEAINRQALRVVKLFGNKTVTSVKTTVGPEQEYFLIDKDLYHKRPDLVYTGRTLFGQRPPKAQELDDHYFGTIRTRVAKFMEELNTELWKLGVLAKTQHNEAAPAQHELAPIYTTTNIATDHNQITMELMQRIAKKHNLVCLLHEKPFAYVSGSGKHNNWSITTNTGKNLLDPGETPYENAQFLLFLCAVLKAVDDYQDLLRLSVASAGNDHRLGANEAPPAVISVFLGDELTDILTAIENEAEYDAKEKVQLKVGVHVLPRFPKDTTDRNRTSPFAFTGNKFEFRMVGSSASVSGANVVLNTAVAESLKQFADALEGKKNFEEELHELIKKVIKEHKRIIFNGNSYDDAWMEEAERRGLLNLRTTPDCLPYYSAPKNLELFASHKVLSPLEVNARLEIKTDIYSKNISIEARTMLDMVKKDILPAITKFTSFLSGEIIAKSNISKDINIRYEAETLETLSNLTGAIYETAKALENALFKASEMCYSDINTAVFYKDNVIPLMENLRKNVDLAEGMTKRDMWPYPSYDNLLFNV